MNGLNRKLKSVLISVASLLLCSGAASAQILQTHVTSASTLDFMDNFTVLPFDTSLGTLYGVEVTLSVDVTADLLVSNINSSGSQSFTNSSATFPIDVTGPTGNANIDLSNTVTSGQFNGTVAAGMTNTYTGMTLSANGSSSVSPADFGFWETSPVNLTLNFSAGDGTIIGYSGLRVLFGGDATGDATTTITYNYTSNEVPEPATAGLMIFALAALILGRTIVARRGYVRRGSGSGLPRRS